MLFSGSCDKEPSYDVVHFGLKAFLEEEAPRRDDGGENGLWEEWRNASIDLGCRLDSAILALAQHYGVPSHGLESPQATMLHCGLPQIDIGGT